MKKDSPVALRVPSELKRKLQRIADEQRRSLSQVCEMLLSAGVEAYEREGFGYLAKAISKRKS